MGIGRRTTGCRGFRCRGGTAIARIQQLLRFVFRPSSFRGSTWLKSRTFLFVPEFELETRLLASGQRPMQFHFDLLAQCCLSVDPKIWVRAQDGIHRLLDLTSPNPRQVQSFLPLANELIEVSACIGKQAQKQAAKNRMPMLSAFDRGTWSFLRSEWEMEEFASREIERRRRANEERFVFNRCPPGQSKLLDRHREKKLQELREKWPTTWLRTWDCDWISCARKSDKLIRNSSTVETETVGPGHYLFDTSGNF